MNVHRATFVTLVTVAGIASAPEAHAQFAIPMQGPAVERAGAFTLIPTIGLVSEDSATSLALFGRARYSLTERLSMTGRLGVMVGDLDEFGFGADLKFQILKDSPSVPVDLSIFGALDFGVGDLTLITMMGGVLVGKTFPAGDLKIGPYGGLGVGFGHASRGGGSNTDPGVGFIMGCNFGINRTLSAFTELDIGLEAYWLLSWHVGISISLGGVDGTSTPAAEPEVTTEVSG
ncbi:MAG: hypothetical protein IPG45_32565 [Deltaproteobacteria bacterium]|jgi:hypothetical protein|nr:hypothetical protein [Deltaproteobacteria bacterium]